jgi:hypothetical protein
MAPCEPAFTNHNSQCEDLKEKSIDTTALGAASLLCLPPMHSGSPRMPGHPRRGACMHADYGGVCVLDYVSYYVLLCVNLFA